MGNAKTSYTLAITQPPNHRAIACLLAYNQLPAMSKLEIHDPQIAVGISEHDMELTQKATFLVSLLSKQLAEDSNDS